MTDEIAKEIISYSWDAKSPETYIQEQFLTHIDYGTSFWSKMVEMSIKMNYSTRAEHLKDRINQFCAKRLQEEIKKAELKSLMEQKESKDQGLKSLQIRLDVVSKLFLITTTLAGAIGTVWQYYHSQAKDTIIKNQTLTIDSLKNEIYKIETINKSTNSLDTLNRK